MNNKEVCGCEHCYFPVTIGSKEEVDSILEIDRVKLNKVVNMFNSFSEYKMKPSEAKLLIDILEFIDKH